ncbi:speckle-type POZ protein B-like [Bradysia coprophila]|uniref:speckle-type POZ protein B-like n=1 Tax=Bradysia coprophila TaxID=38358 RepID=UPI00187DA6AC|nr:speckle-type POZ protein B-like [Bradysia coprophila]
MESTMTTEPKVTLYTFTWKISRFDIICPEKCLKFDKLSSGLFTVKGDEGTESKWSVTIRGSSENLHLFLDYKCAKNADGTDHSESVRCEFTMSIGSDEKNRIAKTTEHTFTKDAYDWGWSSFLGIKELYQKRETLLENNTLHVCVRMRIYGKHSTTVTLLVQPDETVNTLEVLSVELGELFNNKKNSDVEIMCGNETFYAHKLILSARSKVFSAMLDSHMLETVTSKIILNDIDATVFHAILSYIYTGKVDVNDTISCTELIYAAEKYDLSELKQYYFEQMCKGVTVKTIGNLAVAAEIYNSDEKTKQSIKEYCQRNIAALIKDPAIKNLMISHPKAFF